jgi:Tol biopolymer transport system component
MRPSKTGWVLIGLLATAALGVSATASATFPGENGRIAFTEAGNIFTMNSDGSDVRQVTSIGAGFMVPCCEAWSPDGQTLVFPVTNPDFSNIQLWITNADGSNQHLFFDDPAYLDTLPNFSPDGSHVIFSHCIPATFQCGIFKIRTDGTDLTEITGFDPDPDLTDFDAAYSPDGTNIAFTSLTRDGLIDAVYLMDADGSNIRSLIPPALGANKPDWSPDGTRIAFSTEFQYLINPPAPPCLPNPAIWLINAEDRQTIQLTGSTHYLDVAPSWSPQGDAIVFERDTPSGQTAIYVMNMGKTGGAPTLIHQGSSNKRPGSAPAGPASGRNQARARRLSAIEQGGGSPRWGPAN